MNLHFGCLLVPQKHEFFIRFLSLLCQERCHAVHALRLMLYSNIADLSVACPLNPGSMLVSSPWTQWSMGEASTSLMSNNNNYLTCSVLSYDEFKIFWHSPDEDSMLKRVKPLHFVSHRFCYAHVYLLKHFIVAAM